MLILKKHFEIQLKKTTMQKWTAQKTFLKLGKKN